MSQTFRTLIHSRMQVGMERYSREYPDADVVLFQPERDDVEMFFTNVFSYAGRRRLCEHAYQRTREDLRRRRSELEGVFERHGVGIDAKALADDHRTLLTRRGRLKRRRIDPLDATAGELDETRRRLEGALMSYAAPVSGRRAG